MNTALKAIIGMALTAAVCLTVGLCIGIMGGHFGMNIFESFFTSVAFGMVIGSVGTLLTLEWIRR